MTTRTIRGVIAIVALGALIYLGRNYLHDIDRIRQARPLAVLGIAAIRVTTLFLTGWTYRIGLLALQQPVQLREGFAMATLGSFSNLLIPRAGVGLIAAYLKRIRQIRLTDFGCVLLVNGIVFLSVCCLMTAAVVAAAPGVTSGLPSTVVAISCLCVALGGYVATQLHRTGLAKRLGCWQWSLLDRIQFASQKLGRRHILLWLFSLHAAMVFLRAVRLRIAFWGLGFQTEWFPVLAASLFGDLAFIVSVTPSALGFREAAIAWAADQLGVTPAQSISVSLFDRVVFSLATVVAAQAIIARSLTVTSAESPGKRQPDNSELTLCESHDER